MAKKYGSVKQTSSAKRTLTRRRDIEAADSELIEQERFARPGRKRHSCSPQRDLRTVGRPSEAMERPVVAPKLRGIDSGPAGPELDRSTADQHTGRIKSFDQLPELLKQQHDELRPIGIKQRVKRRFLRILNLFQQ